MNQPYIKQFDNNGVCTNEIEHTYINQFPNRQQRRAHKNVERFKKNSKASHLTVMKTGKYSRVVQFIKLKTGAMKQIFHYIMQ